MKPFQEFEVRYDHDSTDVCPTSKLLLHVASHNANAKFAGFSSSSALAIDTYNPPAFHSLPLPLIRDSLDLCPTSEKSKNITN